MSAISPRSGRRLAALLGAGVLGVIPIATAQATTPLGSQVRATVTGQDDRTDYGASDVAVVANPRTGRQLLVYRRFEATTARIYGRFLDAEGTPVGGEFSISRAGFDADKPAVAYNPHLNQFAVTFSRETGSPGEYEISMQLLTAEGAEINDDIRLSGMGPNTDPDFDAEDSSIAYNVTRKEYLVAWEGDDGRGPLVEGETEIFIQRVSEDGTQLGADDQRISDLGTDGDPSFDATDPVVAWNANRDEYMVAWDGADNTPPYALGEREVYVQRLTGDATELGPNDRRVSDVGPPGDSAYDATDASIAYNATADEYMITWDGDDNAGGLVDDEQEIFAQRLAYDGSEVGSDDQRISDVGPNGSTATAANGSRVIYNPRSDEYLVVWYADEATPPMPDDHFEIFAQRLSATGQELDGNDVRVSVMTPESDPAASAFEPYVGYDDQTNQYQIAWTGYSTTPPLVANHAEIYSRRFGTGTTVATTARCKVLAPPPATSPGDPSKVTLSAGQLLINQRISQAAVRRSNGIQGWFDHGVESRDLCQAALELADLSAGSVVVYTGIPMTYTAADPRPVEVAPATPGDPSKVTLSVGQLVINQRISQAAIRRLNGLKARLDAGLTGGDLLDGSVGMAQLRPGTSVLYAPSPATPPAPSVTVVAPATPGDPSKVTLSAGQLLINQRISQAAVNRANDLIRRLGDGIGPEEIRDGSVSAIDLAPGVPVSSVPSP